MSTAATTNGVTVLSRQNGQLLLVAATEATVTMGQGGTPVSDWSVVADQVAVTDLKVGDHVNVGAGMFAAVTAAPRKWRNFTKLTTAKREHQFRAGAMAWRLRTA